MVVPTCLGNALFGTLPTFLVLGFSRDSSFSLRFSFLFLSQTMRSKGQNPTNDEEPNGLVQPVEPAALLAGPAHPRLRSSYGAEDFANESEKMGGG